MDWYVGVWRKFAEFGGRARRTEYWMFALINVIVVVVLAVVDGVVGAGGALSGLYALAVLIPSLSVGARRLHDTGRSGWWQLIALIPLIGAIVLIVFFFQEGEPGDNDHGANPKGQAGD